MKRAMLWIIVLAVAMLSGSALYAQDISGDWQGTLKMGGDFRLILHVTKSDDGGWSAILYDIDESLAGIPVKSLIVRGSTLKCSIEAWHASYEGRLGAGGASIEGTWTEHAGSKPLEFHRAIKQTAWPLPDPSWGHKQVTVDPKIFDGYVGRYQLAPNSILSIMREGDYLYTQAAGQERFKLFPESEKEYFAKIGRIAVSFETDDRGIATGMVVHQGGRDRPAKRIAELTADKLIAKCPAIDSMMAAEFGKHSVGSVTIGVVFRNQLLWTKSYGNADMEKKLPAEKGTVYRIGSITKMFTALMLEQLADAGTVHLSDPVEKYFPEVKTVEGRFPNAPPITLFELATHTSGLEREPADTEKYVQGPVSDWEKTLIAALPHTRYEFEPGTRYSYSNIGFAILGAALSRASGQPYVEYVPKHIFEPLGMTHTALERTPGILPYLSKGYLADEGKVDADTPQREHEGGRGYKVPNGAIYTTVEDLAHFVSFLLGQGPDTVLKASTLERNLKESPVQADFQLSSGYTLGGEVLRRDTYTAFGHNGAVAGYQAGLYINRLNAVGVVVLANALGSNAIDTHSLALDSLDILSK